MPPQTAITKELENTALIEVGKGQMQQIVADQKQGQQQGEQKIK